MKTLIHCHTEYSIGDGLMTTEKLCSTAKHKGYECVTLTDHGVMGGSYSFLNSCKKYGIKPAIGCELYFSTEIEKKKLEQDRHYTHLVAVAKNYAGYRNLVRVSSLGWVNGFYYRPRIDWDILRKYNEGIKVTTACMLGILAPSFYNNDLEGAYQILSTLYDIYGKDNVFLEIQFIEDPTNHIYVQQAINFKRKYPDTKLILGQDSHFATAKDDVSHALKKCITQKLTWRENNLTGTNYGYIRTEDEIWKHWKKLGYEFVDKEFLVEALANTDIFSSDIEEFSIIQPPVLPSIDKLGLPSTTLREMITEGCKLRGILNFPLEKRKQYLAQIKHEYSLIMDLGFDNYFIMQRSIIEIARKIDVLVGPGRGSSAGSLVNYLIGNTNIDPLKYGLMFERFINPARKELPDIDTDYSDIKAVNEELVQQFGAERVSKIATYSTFQIKGLLHDLARVFEYPVAEIMIISKKLDDKNLDQMSIEEIIKACPEFGTWMEHHKVDNVEQHIRNLNGVVRHKGTHAAGVLISGDPLWENFPIERVSNNLVSAFCDGGRSKELMSLGGVKFDILGLNTLQVHKDCAKNIATRKGKNWKELINLFDASQIDDADAKVFNSIFKTGDTCDIFQFESKVAQQLLIDIQPDNVQELGIINAINRPGPLQGGYDRLYINSKFSGIRTKIHPIVDAILDETHGAMIYQEQVIKIARQLGDLTDEEAELFRKLAFKLDRQKNVDVADARMQRILEIIAKWRESAIKKGMTEKAVDDLWKKIEGFLDYAFNKAHAISYSMVGYVSAFMKTYYPIEFHTAYLNNITNDTEKVRFYIKYLRNKGYSIIPPRFDHKIGIDCSVVDDKTIMLGLSIVKNVKAELIVDFIENNRKTITSLKELFIQIQESNGIGKRTIESLILIGFFDNLPVNETVTKMSRAKLGLLYGQWHDSHKPKFKKIEGSKEKLAKIIKKMDEQVDEIVLQDEPKFDPYLVETNLMQFSLTEHPLMKYADIMGPTREKFADFNVVLGEITSMQFKFSKNKKRFAIVIVSDVETHKTHKIMIWDNLIKSYNFQVGDCGIFIITEAHPQFGTCELSQYIK